MGNVIVVDFIQTNGINQFLIEHCGIDKAIEHSLQFFPVAQRRVHLVGLLLQGCHLILN